MATFGEIVYSVLDLLKESSDDAFYTEEHVIFLASQMRSLLLEKKYKGSRNGAFREMSDENRQQVCLSVTTTEVPGCSGMWLKSTTKVPQLLTLDSPVTCTGHEMIPTVVSFIPHERMPYIGHNKWLSNIVYASRGIDGYLYLHGSNPQFMYLDRVGLTGIFADALEAAKYSHEACASGNPGCGDPLEQTFPLESGLIMPCIEMVVQELNGSRFAPEDNKNNAKDDLADAAVTQQRPTNPSSKEEGAEQ